MHEGGPSWDWNVHTACTMRVQSHHVSVKCLDTRANTDGRRARVGSLRSARGKLTADTTAHHQPTRPDKCRPRHVGTYVSRANTESRATWRPDTTARYNVDRSRQCRGTWRANICRVVLARVGSSVQEMRHCQSSTWTGSRQRILNERKNIYLLSFYSLFSVVCRATQMSAVRNNSRHDPKLTAGRRECWLVCPGPELSNRICIIIALKFPLLLALDAKLTATLSAKWHRPVSWHLVGSHVVGEFWGHEFMLLQHTQHAVFSRHFSQRCCFHCRLSVCLFVCWQDN